MSLNSNFLSSSSLFSTLDVEYFYLCQYNLKKFKTKFHISSCKPASFFPNLFSTYILQAVLAWNLGDVFGIILFPLRFYFIIALNQIIFSVSAAAALHQFMPELVGLVLDFLLYYTLPTSAVSFIKHCLHYIIFLNSFMKSCLIFWARVCFVG